MIIIIINKNYFIKYIYQNVKKFIIKVFSNFFEIILNLFFSTPLKRLNIIKFTIIFGIIHHHVISFISNGGNKLLDFVFLCFKIRVKKIKINSILFSINKLGLIIFNNYSNYY